MAARFGQPVSRALAADLATAGGRAAAAALPALAGADGERLAEGGAAGAAGAGRHAGVACAPTGRPASIRGAWRAGSPRGRKPSKGAGSSREVLSDYAPQWRDLTPIEIGNDALYFAPGSTAGGDILSRIWPLLEDGGYGRAEAAERPVRLVAAWREVAGGMAGRRVPPGATVATVDSLGRAVVCSFSLGRLFGSGVPVGDTGLFLAPSAPGVRPAGRRAGDRGQPSDGFAAVRRRRHRRPVGRGNAGRGGPAGRRRCRFGGARAAGGAGSRQPRQRGRKRAHRPARRRPWRRWAGR